MVKNSKIEKFKQRIEEKGLSAKKIAIALGTSPDNFRQSLYRGTLSEAHFGPLSKITGMDEKALRETFSVAKTRVRRDEERNGQNILPLITKVVQIVPTGGVLSLGDVRKLMRVESEWGSPLSLEVLHGLLLRK